jgi:hypothetical protein
VPTWGAIRPYLLLIVVLAALLHGYQLASSPNPLSSLWVIGFMIWSLTPYVLCLIIASISVSPIPACVGASAALIFDGVMHFDVITSKSSTAALGYIFMPLWNLVLVTPFTMLMAWLAVKARAADADAP